MIFVCCFVLVLLFVVLGIYVEDDLQNWGYDLFFQILLGVVNCFELVGLCIIEVEWKCDFYY